MRFRHAIIASAALFSCEAAWAAAWQISAHAYKTNLGGIMVAATVTDENGAPVTGLRETDFRMAVCCDGSPNFQGTKLWSMSTPFVNNGGGNYAFVVDGPASGGAANALAIHIVPNSVIFDPIDRRPRQVRTQKAALVLGLR